MIFNGCSISDLVSQSPGIVMLKGADSVIHGCSYQMAKLAGFDNPSEMQGLRDEDMRCDAAAGAEQFVSQDQYALTHGEHRSIDIYTYADGNKVIMYGEKKALMQNGKAIGVYASGHDLTHLNSIANHFLGLLQSDGKFLSYKNTQTASYSYQLADSYPDIDLTMSESLCLFYVLRGKSNKEIARILNLSFRTIDGRVEAIKQKLDCHSKYQLIEYAQQRGYLSIILRQLLLNNNLSLSLSLT